MSERSLFVASIEVFHDQECGPSPFTDEVLEGIEKVNEVTGGLDIVNVHRGIKIAREGAEAVNVNSVRWPRFPANLNIVITDRPVIKADMSHVNPGQFLTGTSQRKSRVAVVTAKAGPAMKLSTTHELGHLFGLKSPNTRTSHTDGCHCNGAHCAMSPEAEFSQHEEPTRLFSMPRRSQPVQRTPRNTDFCGDCADELVHHANIRALEKLKNR
jgi:hypothetical protein